MRIKNFFKLIFFEIKKIYRSKFVFYFLLFAPLVISFSIAFIVKSIEENTLQSNLNEKVLFVSEVEEHNDATVKIIENVFGKEIQIDWQQDLNGALNKLKLSQVILVVYENDENNEMTIFYDISSDVSIQFKNTLMQNGYKFAYTSIKETLVDEWGINIGDYSASPEPVVNKKTPLLMRLEAVSIALILGFFLTVGISYTMSRDNETGIIKQLNYTPMKIGKYISIRSVFFIIMLFIQILVMLGIFAMLGVGYGTAFLGLFTFSLLFGIAYMGLSFIFANTKNQLSTISLAVVFILIPAIIAIMGFSGMSPVIKAILYLSPLTPFVQLFNTYIHYEIINILPLIVLIMEAVVYYLGALLIMKSRTNKQKIKKIKA